MKNTNTKKCLSVALAGVLAGISVANAEKSGVFAGLEAGLHIAKYKFSYQFSYQEPKPGIGGIYGLLVGYKQFFTPYIGARYYANLNYKDRFLIHYDPMMLNYGVNVDFLGNFVSREDLDFGGFVGLGLGGNTISVVWGNTQLDVGLNFGLHTTFESQTSFELVARVPFLPIKLSREVVRRDNIYEYSSYSVALRYTYAF